jgi:hypothetical protein
MTACGLSRSRRRTSTSSFHPSGESIRRPLRSCWLPSVPKTSGTQVRSDYGEQLLR